ncbi:choice-of-anchor I domain-containing protein [Haloferula sp. A504]|uniref:choice-of-anchor I domain-containing protein n=1 Tax=Haloferula sp. A504 TaxID=3373601 RepID=UPI0031C9D119|nr:5'-nucleotidase C-terminal domain-containing protein [Verrucomicrobiaceae bacterium E54]
MNHIRTILRLAAATPLVGLGIADADLIITGVVDGPLSGGTPKAIELYATEAIADLSIYGIGSANNGGGSDGEEFTLSGSATAGQFLYVASEQPQFNAFFGFDPDFTTSAAGINGDDAIELFQNGSVIDVFGDINAVPGAWDYEDGWAYRNDETGPDGTTFAIGSWSFSGVGALVGETTNATAATPFPIGTYTSAPPVPPAAPEEVSLYQAILTGEGSGEVVSHAKIGSDFVLAVTDNPNGGVTILNWVDGNQKYQTQFSIDVLAAVTNGKEVSSVALDPRGTGLGAAAVQVDDPAINTSGSLSIPQIGAIVFFDATTGTVIGQATTGYHPDMVTFSPGGICAVANEGEYAWDTATETGLPTQNQNGSVSLYDLTAVTAGNLAPAASITEVNVDFIGADLTGIRYGTVESMEPEYIVFDAGDGIFVGCQENNAVAYLADVSGILAGTTTPSWIVNDLGRVSYTTDASDRDGLDISDPITGLSMPDAIATFEISGTTYVVTADEGDARPDDSDIARAGSFASDADNLVAATPLYDAGSGPLSQPAFDALLQDNDELGRIDVLIDQSTNGSGELEDIVGLGTRGISILEFDPVTSSLTRVSHLPFESYLAQQDPERHNANDGGDPGEFDARSDNKGPEPEAVSVITLGAKTIAVVGNERQNSVVMVDITDPANPAPISYINNRDNGLFAPETVQTIAAADSPTGSELAIFGYEGDGVGSGISGGIGIYNLENSDSFNLTILHNNDGESDLFKYKDSADHGGIARFKTAMDAHHDFYTNIGHGVVEVFAGDSLLAGPEFQASLDSGAPGSRTFYDALALSRIGYDAFAIGNHEMDFGPDVLAEFIGDAQTTNPSLYLSANLDFTNEADMLAQQTAGNVARSAIVEVPTDGGAKKVGIIGATTENLPFITSPRDTIINAVAASVNSELASLQGQDVDAIVLVSHLQGLATDQDLVPNLAAGIDVIVAGGGDELLVNQTAVSPRSVYGPSAPASVIDTAVFAGDTIEGTYPTVSTATDLGGNNIPIVTGAGSYGYLNRVTLNFSGGGVSVESTSNPALIVSDSAEGTNGYAADADVASDIAPVQIFLDALAATVIGNTATTLPQSSDLVRSDERAVGNLVADAYLAKAQELAASFGVDSPQVAMANGGGIRAAVPAGDITLQTTFNVSPFGNFVAVVEDVTTADLKILLENCYSQTIDNDPTNGVDPVRSGAGTGRFAQIAGMEVVYDISKTAMVLPVAAPFSVSTRGTRIVSAKLEDGTELIVDGQPVPGVTVDIAMPAFTAAGGDQWFRYESNGTEYYTSVQYPYTALGVTDQQALADHIIALDGTANGTGPALDGNNAYNESIKDGRILTLSDRDSDGLLDQVEEALGTDPDVNEQDPAAQLAAIAAKEAADIQSGEDNVTGDPAAFDLYTETSILDLRMNGVMGAVDTGAGTATLNIDVFSTADLGAAFPSGWTKQGTQAVTVPAPPGKQFYRLNADQP